MSDETMDSKLAARCIDLQRHRFSPCGVLCDLAPVEVCDWVQSGRTWLCDLMAQMAPSTVDVWACGPQDGGFDLRRYLNGHGTRAATVAAIKKLGGIK